MAPSDYSTTVVRAAPTGALRSSILTVRPPSSDNDSDGITETTTIVHADIGNGATNSMLSIESFHTAAGSFLSVAGATEGGSTLRRPDADEIGGSTLRAVVNAVDVAGTGESSVGPNDRLPLPSPLPGLLHRFTLIKPGAKRTGLGSAPSSSGTTAPSTGSSATANPESPSKSVSNSNGAMPPIPTVLWSPFDFFFSTGLLVARCDLCSKRLGWKPVLECDDCGLR